MLYYANFSKATLCYGCKKGASPPFTKPVLVFYVAKHEQEQEAAAKRSFATAGIIVDERLTKLRFVMLLIITFSS